MASITKRNKSYLIRVSCGYDENGKQIVKSKTYKPDPEMTEKQAEKEVLKQAELFESEMKNKNTLTGDMTINNFCTLYLEIKKDVLAERTLKWYISVIKNAIIPTFDGLKLHEIRTAHIQNFVNILKQSGIAPATVRRKLAVLQSILKLSENLELIPASPVKISRLTMPKTVKSKTEIFTRQEITEILTLIKEEPLYFQLAVQLAIITGARRGEIGGMRYSDFDFANCTVTICRSAYKPTGKPVRTKAPKDNECRTVAITPECLHLVRLYKLRNHAKNDDFIFTKNGEIMNPQSISSRFFRFLKKHGFRHRKFHALRHTSATLLLYGGVDVNQVRNRLGHGSLRTTQIYIHCIPDADRQAVGVLQSLIFKKISSGVGDADEPTEKTA